MPNRIRRRSLLGAGMGALTATAASGQTSSAPTAACWARPLAQDYTEVFHHPAGGRGLDGPGLARMPDGILVAVVPVRPDGGAWTCHILRSTDRGRIWRRVSQLPYTSAMPWEHRGALYLFAHPEGTPPYREDDLMLLRSDDAGSTWSNPATLFEGHFWNCQTGTAILDNRIYWAVDDYVATEKRGPRLVAADLSADLMNSESWRISNHVPFPGLPESLANPGIKGSYPSQRMLEPNVLNVGGRLRVLAAVKTPLQATTNLAAVFDATDDGRAIDLSFTQFHPMPGGQVKFCILWDDISGMFWATVNLAADGQDRFQLRDPEERRSGGHYNGAFGGNDRRFLMLMYGIDGLDWFPAGCIARAEKVSQSFMYPSHVIDGEDLIVIARSSVRAPNRHDADYATFHRVRGFRSLAMNLR